MAARIDHTTDSTHEEKAMLFCQECDHKSALTGDWKTEENSRTVRYVCPNCESTVVEQSPPRLAVC